MQTVTIRLYSDTIGHLDEAAKRAGVPRGTFIRKHLEQTFDGKPHNPLGVSASPAFYTMLCEAIGIIHATGLSLDKLDSKIAKKIGEQVRKELEIDYEHWPKFL